MAVQRTLNPLMKVQFFLIPMEDDFPYPKTYFKTYFPLLIRYTEEENSLPIVVFTHEEIKPGKAFKIIETRYKS